MSKFSLQAKFLLVLNGTVLAIWTAYAAWSLHETEEQFVSAEVRSIRHLAMGLKLLVEHHIRTHDDVSGLRDELESLLPETEGLDIMLIDRELIVRLATQQDRVGKRWFEEGIVAMFEGRVITGPVNRHHYHEGRRAIDVNAPVRNTQGDIVLVVHVARWLDHMRIALNRQLVSHGVFAIVLLIVVGSGLNLLTYRVFIRPLRAISDELGERGWLPEERVRPRGDDLQQLQAALTDTMTEVERKTGDLQERLKRSQRLAVIGQMSAALAHELRNPLHIVRGTAETMLRRFPESGEFVRDIEEEVDRVEHLIGELLDYTRQTEPVKEPCSAGSLLENVRDRLVRTRCVQEEPVPGPAIEVEVEEAELTLWADPVMLEQALTNLLQNAVEATPVDGLIVMRARGDRDAGVMVEVVDSGPGIAEEDLAKVSEPFFTRKTEGTGLGLAVVEKIADLHGGSLEIGNRDAGGARTVLRFPRSATDPGEVAR